MSPDQGISNCPLLAVRCARSVSHCSSGRAYRLADRSRLPERREVTAPHERTPRLAGSRRPLPRHQPDRLPAPPRPDEQIETLCGRLITLTRADFRVFAEYRPHRATCWACDRQWRRLEGLPPNPALTGLTGLTGLTS
ncbi:hypothetical protein F0L68_22185 [Solihabitans fulvus]|uniref:Zinc-finger n=1 Tax=Solihabitans fulvus TaxID=1892852 RepID=A0A5B2X5B8_9PSEU|nr:hypothetical protein F0L68_22185 [Solihabitans fulvus]